MTGLCSVLFIFALSVQKSKGNNDKDNSCFNFDNRGLVNSRSEGPAGSGSEYAIANLTHSKWLSVMGSPDQSEESVINKTSILLESGQEKVIELNAEGELGDGNPRELTIAFDGTLVDAAIGIHTMWDIPSRNITRDEWRCWNWSKPLLLGQWEWELTRTKFCANYSEPENGTYLAVIDEVELKVQKHWRRPHFSGNEDIDCFNSQIPKGQAPKSVSSTPAPPSKVKVEVRHWHNLTTQVELTEGEVSVVHVYYDSRHPEIFQDQDPRNLSLLYGDDVVWVGLALLEEKQSGFSSYSTWWTCDGGNMARLSVPNGTAKLPLYTFHLDEDERSDDMITVSVMGDEKESAASQHNSFSLILLLSVLYISFS